MKEIQYPVSYSIQQFIQSLTNITFSNSLALNKSLFEYKYAIGRGGFGKVWRVSSNRLKQEKITQFAMKEMLKARVMHKKSI